MAKGWTHVAGSPGMGLQEQWIFRPERAPLCALKKLEVGWTASLLNREGISACVMFVADATALSQAQATCETTLREMGWSWGNEEARA